MNKLKNQLLRSAREVRSQGKPLPQLDRLAEEYGETIEWSRNTPAETPTGTRGRERWETNWLIAGGCVWVSLRNKKSRGTQSLGASHTVWVSTPVVLPGLTVSIKEILCSSRGEERNHFEICQTILVWTSSVLRRNFNQSLTDLGEGNTQLQLAEAFYMEDGKYQNSTPSSYPFLSNGGKGAETHCWCSQSRSTASLKDRPIYRPTLSQQL